MKRFLVLALGLVAAAAPAQTVRDPAPRLPTIAMDTSSWGRPVSSWTVDARGKGSYTRSEPDAHSPKQIVTRSFDAGTRGFRTLRAVLAPTETRSGDLPCGARITDQYYGRVRWLGVTGRVREVRYDQGCRDRGTRRILAQIGKADTLVAGWAAAGSIIETREVKPE